MPPRKAATRRQLAPIADSPRFPPPDPRLCRVEPGPDAILIKRASDDIDEWISGWSGSAVLVEAGVPPPGPLFLHGPPGTGKTSVTRMIAARLAGERDVFVIDAMRVMSKFMGEMSGNFSAAATAALNAGAVLVLEEIDTMASVRAYATSSDVENTRATTSVMRVLELAGPIILTSNRMDVLDPAIIRRCEYIVEMPQPTPDQVVTIVERELGANLCHISIPSQVPLATAIACARRSRRIAVLNGVDPVYAFIELLKREA